MLMDQRLAAVRGEMGEAGADAFFSLSPTDNEYLTGFRGTTSALLITVDRAILLCDFRYTEQAQQQALGFEVVEVTGSLETRVGERLVELGVSCAAFEPGRLTVLQHATVAKAFPEEALIPAQGGIARGREVKDAEEINRIRAASELAEGALEAVLPELREGVTEREFAARLEYEFQRRGATGVSFPAIVLFGARSSLPHGVPGGKRLERGDIVLIDCGCLHNSYCSDLTRTFVFDRIPGAWFQEIYALTLSAQLAALAAVRPGVKCVEVDAVARDIIKDAGYGDRFGHGLGHGVGLEIHESPRLNIQSEAVLRPGHIVTVEPGIYLPDRGGVRIEDLVVVTEDGCEVLTQLPKELKVLHA